MIDECDVRVSYNIPKFNDTFCAFFCFVTEKSKNK